MANLSNSSSASYIQHISGVSAGSLVLESVWGFSRTRPLCQCVLITRAALNSSQKRDQGWPLELLIESGRVVTLQVLLAPGASVKKAAGAVKQAIQKGSLQQLGYSWADPDQYEHEVNILQRFLVDTSVSGGMPHATYTCADPSSN